MSTFLEDVVRGLSSDPKSIPSRYFYDEKGDKLFQQIMKLEEYYLPDAELEILNHQTGKILRDLNLKDRSLDVIELGAGDGSKTLSFLQQAVQAGVDIHYFPLDISPDILTVNKNLIQKKLPGIEVHPVAGDFFKTLEEIPRVSARRMILFMGSNIGNLTDKEIERLLDKTGSAMENGDALLSAFDLKKSPYTILKAYNDSAGVTRQFNLNLLHRINRELGADFDVSRFEHYPAYDPVSGTVYSYLISKQKQTVHLDDGNHSFQLTPFEAIKTEISRKFSLPEIEHMCRTNGFNAKTHYTDKKKWYTLTLIEQM